MQLTYRFISGIDPDAPNISDDNIAEARRLINYDPNARNIVVTGNLNAGKSSLINAIRNRAIHDDDYAPTGAAETTMNRDRYADPIHDGYIWYDTPGAGTQNVTAFGYYYNQNLFAYDLVVLVHDSTLTEVCQCSGIAFFPSIAASMNNFSFAVRYSNPTSLPAIQSAMHHSED